MPYFLSRDEIYKILQRELPEGVYPDGAPSSYYSTADMAAVGDVVASGYRNAERIYDNYWPRTADEKLSDWEILAFGRVLPLGLGLNARRDRVEQKIRTRKGLTIQDIKDTVLSVIGTDKLVDVVEWNCVTQSWMLDYSELGISTILNNYRMSDVAGEDLCEKTAADFGLSEEVFEEMKTQAYTYEVRIYGYELNSDELFELNQSLDAAEPARSTRRIVDGLNPETMLGFNYGGFVSLLTEGGDTLITENGGLLGIG